MGAIIDKDRQRYLDIVKGRAKKDVGKFIEHIIDFVPKRGEGILKVPYPIINLPRFKYGDVFGEDEGEGEGDGRGKGDKKAGQEPGRPMTVDIEFDEKEILQMLEAELPRIKPKGTKKIISDEYKFSAVSKVGPRSRVHKLRSFLNAFKRAMTQPDFDPEHPLIVPVKREWRYKSYDVTHKEQNNAVIIFGRDVSGSMGEEENNLVRFICWCAETWLKHNYTGLETAYIIHDTEAQRLATLDEFLETERGGGTTISSCFKLAYDIIATDFPPELWNIYLMYFSDGFNWGKDDDLCIKILRENFLPAINQFCYGEIDTYRSWWGSMPKESKELFSEPGRFGRKLAENFKGQAQRMVVWHALKNKGDAWKAFKKFYGKGN